MVVQHDEGASLLEQTVHLFEGHAVLDVGIAPTGVRQVQMFRQWPDNKRTSNDRSMKEETVRFGLEHELL